MKYYRCPHCGEPTINKLIKNAFRMNHRTNTTRFEKWSNNREYWLKCKTCLKPYTVRDPYKNTAVKILEIVGVIFVFLIAVFLFLLTSAFKELIFFAIVYAIIIMPAIAFGIMYLINSKCMPVAVDVEDYRFNEPLPNVSVELLEIAKNIHNYDIHAIKFDAKTENIRFKEAFTKEQVPMMFLKKTRAQITPIEAYIIKKEFVPDELLFVGSSFSIVDTNGTIIGKGKIHKIYQ